MIQNQLPNERKEAMTKSIRVAVTLCAVLGATVALAPSSGEQPTPLPAARAGYSQGWPGLLQDIKNYIEK